MAPTKSEGSMSGNNPAASRAEMSSVSIPRYRPRACTILSQSIHSGELASCNPPVMRRPQSCPDALSSSGYSSTVYFWRSAR